ncbi:M28 family metallopeptidase [Actinokineospora globicatena]|uniref:Amidohydrolase n=1 Tax=Actinokineospora globicatena TaxID=103729 RepID=A0A9W6QNT4_9PSEU|nr:M28 family metallopeptidase [Actinokineospora globicatena]MCP2301084.1 aminopeptidase Y Metallo peptidase, MEROPS family M28A [Actinokineospora globicatena]GLW77280.1 amidohydrolase [Actinokineospora globicatena]GLW84114.1 amidohydrolase [Actinokineospora globicatena]GLW91942.1 amidohydrolase [Actinokineospora globicatena]
MSSPRTSVRAGALLLAACAGLAFAAVPASAQQLPDGPALAKNLAKKVTASGINRHLIALQRIADKNGGNRAAGTKGYDQSLDYVAGLLRGAGFEVSTPAFTYPVQITDAAFADAGGTKVDAFAMQLSPQTPVGGVTGALVAVPQDATPGCEATDYTGLDVKGKVALVRRGACTFNQKQANAAAAGAIAILVANNADGPLQGVTVGEGATIPTGGISKADGDTLFGKNGVSTTVDLRFHTEDKPSRNLIAETKTGRKNNVVMVGSHLDSVDEGPGINDNGTGSAALLETALQLGASPKVSNAVRFAWWGAEELGLVGSTKYVQSLTFEQQLDIALYLNFDMIASPNSGYFVYDGDNSDGVGAGEGPYGSSQIEAALAGFLNETGTPTEGTDFDGRSDYGEFIANGIPAGGIFTGAEGVKTAAQAEKWGGTAGVAYDKCYHSKCDNLGNIDRVALDRNADAIAWVTASYAISTEDINGVPPKNNVAKAAKAAARKSLIAGQAKKGKAAKASHAAVR